MSVFRRGRILFQYLWLFATVTLAQEAPTGSPTALPPGDYDGCYGADGGKIAIGSETKICLMVGAGTNWAAGIPYTRLSFQPQADQYSRLFIAGSYRDLINNPQLTQMENSNLTVSVAYQDKLSFLRQYYDVSAQRIYPYLTAIADVKKGTVEGIAWDDACVFCGGFGQCQENTYDFNGILQSQSSAGQPTRGCFLEKADCDAVPIDQPNPCDLTLYVVWTGTDKDGKALLSSAYRFSSFPAQEIQDRITRNLPQINNPLSREREL